MVLIPYKYYLGQGIQEKHPLKILLCPFLNTFTHLHYQLKQLTLSCITSQMQMLQDF